MVPKSKCDVWNDETLLFYNHYYIKVNNQCRKGDEPVQFFLEGTVFMARCSRKPAQLSSHSELAANRIIQALVTLCTWQKYEDSWNKISCDWPKKNKTLCYCTHRMSFNHFKFLECGRLKCQKFCRLLQLIISSIIKRC